MAGFALRFWKRALGNKLLILSGALFLILGFLPIGHNMMVFLETRYERPISIPKNIDGIIVLGGTFKSSLSHKRQMLATNGNIARMIDFVDLSRKYPKAKLIFSGGSGNIYDPKRKEADDAKAFLEMIGIDTHKIIFERNSRNSYENVKYSKELIQPKEGEAWLLVTSAFHIPRSLSIFKQQNWEVIPYPSAPKTDGEYRLLPQPFSVLGNFLMLQIALKEFIGIAIYYFSGKSAFLFPVTPLESEKLNTLSTTQKGTQ